MLKTRDTDVNVSLTDAFEGTAARVTVTTGQVKLHVDKQIRLKRNDIRTVKIVSKETGILYSKQTETVVRQGHRMPAKYIKQAHSNVLFDALIAHSTNISVCVRKQMVLCAYRDSFVNSIE